MSMPKTVLRPFPGSLRSAFAAAEHLRSTGFPTGVSNTENDRGLNALMLAASFRATGDTISPSIQARDFTLSAPLFVPSTLCQPKDKMEPNCIGPDSSGSQFSSFTKAGWQLSGRPAAAISDIADSGDSTDFPESDMAATLENMTGNLAQLEHLNQALVGQMSEQYHFAAENEKSRISTLMADVESSKALLDQEKQNGTNPIDLRHASNQLSQAYIRLSDEAESFWKTLEVEKKYWGTLDQLGLIPSHNARLELWQQIFSLLPMEYTLSWSRPFQDQEFLRIRNKINNSIASYSHLSSIKTSVNCRLDLALELQKNIKSKSELLNTLIELKNTIEKIDESYANTINEKIERALKIAQEGDEQKNRAKIASLEKDKEALETGPENLRRERATYEINLLVRKIEKTIAELTAHVEKKQQKVEALQIQISEATNNTPPRVNSLNKHLLSEQESIKEFTKQIEAQAAVMTSLIALNLSIQSKLKSTQECLQDKIRLLIQDISQTESRLGDILNEAVLILEKPPQDFSFNYSHTSFYDTLMAATEDFFKQCVSQGRKLTHADATKIKDWITAIRAGNIPDTDGSIPPAIITKILDIILQDSSESVFSANDITLNMRQLGHDLNLAGQQFFEKARSPQEESTEKEKDFFTGSQFIQFAKIVASASGQYIHNEFSSIRKIVQKEMGRLEIGIRQDLSTQTERLTWLTSHFVRHREQNPENFYDGLVWLGKTFSEMTNDLERTLAGSSSPIPASWVDVLHEWRFAKKQMYELDATVRQNTGFYRDEIAAFEKKHHARVPDRLPLFMRPGTEIDNSYRDSGSNPRFFQTGLGTAIMYPNEGELLESDQGVMIAFHGACTQMSSINSSGSFMRKVVSAYPQINGNHPGLRGLSVVAVSNPFHEFGPHDPQMNDMNHLLDWVDSLTNYYGALLQTKTGRAALPVILFGRSTGSNIVLEHAHRRGTRPVVGMSGYAPTPYWNYHDFDALEKLGRNFNERAVQWVQKLETQWTYHKRAIPLLTSALILAGLLDPGYPKTLPDRYPPEVTKLLPELTDKNPRDLELTLPEYWQDVHARFGPSAELFVDPQGDHNLFMTINSETGQLDLAVQATAMAKLAAFLDRVLGHPDTH